MPHGSGLSHGNRHALTSRDVGAGDALVNAVEEIVQGPVRAAHHTDPRSHC